MTKFNAEKEIENILTWIKEWFNQNGPEAIAVIGISGGKDSTIVAKLCVEALGKDRVLGVLMPNGVQNDIEDSYKVVEELGINHLEIDISGACNVLDNEIKFNISRATNINISRTSQDRIINMPARIRMTTLYAVAQSLLINGGMVINTCNKSEDYIGYSTKYGDNAGDMSPCANYTVTEMLMIGDKLGLPEDLVHKTPSDGLCGQTDEDKLGFTYETLDKYIMTGVCEDEIIKDKIDRMHAANLHKLEVIPSYKRDK